MWDKFKAKLYVAYLFALDRMGEPTTWQGVGFLVGLTGSHFGAGLNWGEGAAFGGTLSAFIKTVTKG